jgi:SAM-dependent methyltransferase
VARCLQHARPRKLQIGAGSLALPGWLNTDLEPPRGAIYLDATRRFPFADATFDYVLSEHQIEHLPYAEGLFMLREAHRVLRPGGRVRIATPDLDRLLSLLRDRDGTARKYVEEIVWRFVPDADVPRPAFAVNNVLYGHGHRFLYDEETLVATLERAGFVDPRRFAPGESDDDDLRGVEGHGGGENPELNVFDTLVVEARRPAE